MSESETMFQLYDGVFWLSVLLAFIGLAIIGAVVWFGFDLAKRFRNDWELEATRFHISNILELWRDLVSQKPPHQLMASERVLLELHAIIAEYGSNYRQNLNVFWLSYGQVVIAMFVVLILAILLLTRTVSAEAGLPILSAMSGYAIAKGVSSARETSVSPKMQSSRRDEE